MNKLKRTRRRWALAGSVLLVVGAVAYLAFGSFQANLVYFHTPTEILQKEQRDSGPKIRVGGMVEEGSLRRTVEGQKMKLDFVVTDGRTRLPVRFEGIPPDLFKEKQGAVVEGWWTKEKVFKADVIMAKHDENYMPIKMEGSADDARAKAGKTMKESR